MAATGVVQAFGRKVPQKEHQKGAAKAAYNLCHRHCVEHVAFRLVGDLGLCIRFPSPTSRYTYRDQSPFWAKNAGETPE
jgi:hypothetical protein